MMKRIPVGIAVGDSIPQIVRDKAKTYDGAYGRYFESVYSQYHKMNSGKGVDLEDAGIEIKSKKDGGAGALTVGSVTLHENTSRHLIPVLIRHIIAKMQEQVIIKHNTLKVTAIESHNFNNEYYQNTLVKELTTGLTRAPNEDYDSGRSATWRKIKLAGIGHLENREGETKWTLRLSDKDFSFAKSSGQFDKLFDVAE